MAKRLLALLLVSVFILNNGLLYSTEPLKLDLLVKEALTKNPEILAAKKRYEAAKARIPQARSLDDPVIGLAFQYTPGSPFQLDKTQSMERSLSFSQFLPFFGKLSLKGKIALVESQMAAAEYKDKELEVINSVESAYYGLFLNHKESELNSQSLVLLDSILKVAEAKYTVGKIPQEELYKINAEKARTHNAILNLTEERKADVVRINTLLNRDPEGPLTRPELSQDLSFKADIRSLYESATLNRPEILLFAYAIEKNKHAKSLAKKSFFPDLLAGIAMRGITTGTIGPWDLMLAFSVPLWFWTKQRYMVKEAVANLEEAEAAYQAVKNRSFAQIKDIVSKIEVAKNKARISKLNLIPILESSIEVSQAAYRSGQGDFLALLDNQRMLIEEKMNYYRQVVAYNINLSGLKRAIGDNFSAKPEVKDEKN